MRTEHTQHGEAASDATQMLINQLREITGIQDPQLLCRALSASGGDVAQAVSVLTAPPAEVRDPGEDPDQEAAPPGGGGAAEWEAQRGTHKDELQTAIERSLQESHSALEEERQFSRALEASAEENLARMKRKRSEAQSDVCNPAEWIRQDDWPVGIRNVGNTCWFSAVIQSLFHLPVFRRLVLNYRLSERILEKCKSQADKRNIAFMQELRCLFALMVGSARRFVDPSAAVELLRDAFRTSEAQQDVSEFSHKLLDWLEDAFQLASTQPDAHDKQENPMVQLFYGTFVTERQHEGRTLCNTEQFGQYPLQVNGFSSLDECLEGAMVERHIESLHSEHAVTSGRERWFKRLPPVLTFELSRFEFNTQLGRPEKIHKKLEFPQIIYMDRYLHKNIQKTHERRVEVKRLKEQLAALQQKLECYRSFGSGPAKYPLAHMLQFVLEFATTRPSGVSPALEDARTATSSPLPPAGPEHGESGGADSSEGPVSGVSSCQRTPIYKPFTQCRPPTEGSPQPAPHSVSEEELHFVKTCLQRWRAEVESDIQELKANIDRISQVLEGVYSDTSLCQVPYRLHAVLVHEGQASAGHYWAYIYDHAHQRWMKYNDVNITESSWDELERDSFGGMTNASAYCLMYIDDRLPDLITEDTDDETGQVLLGMDSLPPALRRFVHEDNRWFQQELSEWEEQFCQTAAPQGETTGSAQPPDLQEEAGRRTPDGPDPGSAGGGEEPDHGEASELQAGAEGHNQPEGAAEEDTSLAPPTPSPGSQPEEEGAAGSEAEAEAAPQPHADLAEQEPQSQAAKAEAQPSPEALSDPQPEQREVAPPPPPAAAAEAAAEAAAAAAAAAPCHSEDCVGCVGCGAAGGPEACDGGPEASPEAPETEAEAASNDERPQRQPAPESEVSEVDIPNVGRILVRADADGYNEETMLSPAMQGVIMAIAKARSAFDRHGAEAGLIKAFHEEYCRLHELAQEEAAPAQDARLHHALVYFFQNQAPKRVIERTLLENFTDRNLSFDQRAISIMREARAKLRLIKPEDMDMDEYLQWHEDYRLFRTVFVYLLTGLEHYQHGRLREALSYLTHAYQSNATLLRSGERRGVDASLIALYRRKTLTMLNESASQLFCSGEEEKVEEGVAMMDEAIIPCLHLMSGESSLSQEDREAMESIRSHWCCCLGQDLDESLQVKLGEFLPRVLDCSAETVVLKDPPTVSVNQSHDLCSRLAAVMESIHNTSVVVVK